MKPRLHLRFALSAALLLASLMACNAPATLPAATTSAPPAATPQAATVAPLPPSARAPDEVLGSVQIEHGQSASGGTAGTTIQVEIDLSATSTSGKVTEMRVAAVGGCDNRGQVDKAQWQPFAPVTHLPASLGINWVGFYVAAQFRDDKGIVSPIYCDDISLEGMPAVPAVNPTDWYSQIQCFAEGDVHPSQGETVRGLNVTFSWPNTNKLPDGVFYQVNAYSAVDQYTALVAQGRTRDASLTVQIPADKAGDIVWYIVLTDANGTFLDHGRCGSFAASLLTVDPPSGIKGVHFTYEP